ncbi:helix-turn-helix domain-containing protein, partial [Mycobacteroides abscessus]
HTLQPAQRAVLLRHPWPGNVRELQNAAERFALGLELALDGQAPPATAAAVPVLSGNLSEQVEQFERSLIAAELAQPHSSMRSLAEALGIPRKTLHDKLRKHSLSFDGGSGGHDDQEDHR